MTEPEPPTDNALVSCATCMKEVPISEAKSPEATDYVVHFCGLECYEKWAQQEADQGIIKAA